jgi:hypothetical protein
MAWQRPSPSTRDEQGDLGNLLFSEGRIMRNFMWAALVTGFLLAGTGAASADDTVRLGGPSAQAAIQGGTDTELVHGRHGYYGGGYGRGYYGGGYYGRGNYGGGYYGARYYSPYYYSAYYRPYYYTPTYSYPQYYRPYYSVSYSYPIAGEAVPPPATTLQANFYLRTPTQQQYSAPMPMPSNGNGTFQYDGGPRSPIPLPNPAQETNPANGPRGIIPIDGRLVSLPAEASGGTSQVGTPLASRATSAPRAAYPAYGEEPITPVPRKTSR